MGFREITRLFNYYKVKNRAVGGISLGLLRIAGIKIFFLDYTIKYIA